MSGGKVQAALDAMTPEQRRGALLLLDHMTRPLTQKEIAMSLMDRGVCRSRAVLVASAVKRWHIVAMIGGENG